MSRYRDFVLKHIDKIDPNDADQRREFFALVRASVEKQIRGHYPEEAQQQTELAELESAIAAIDASYHPAPAPPPLDPALPSDVSLPKPKRQPTRISRKILAGLVVLSLGFIGLAYGLGLFSACPKLTCHDSGWVRARNNEANTIIVPHTLGRLPRHISLWYSRTGTEDVAQPVMWSWNEVTTGNPVDIQVSPSETKLFIQPDKPLHGLMDSRYQWLTQETGFFRVIVRK